MKQVAGVPQSAGTRITVAALSRVHAAAVIEQTRISAVIIEASPKANRGILSNFRAKEVIHVTERPLPASANKKPRPVNCSWLGLSGLCVCPVIGAVIEAERSAGVNQKPRDYHWKLASRSLARFNFAYTFAHLLWAALRASSERLAGVMALARAAAPSDQGSTQTSE
jgi:hypothetical protein